MRSLFICAVAVILGCAYVKCDFKEEMHKRDETCREETHVSSDEVKSYFKGDMKDEDVKDNLKCYMKCMMEKQGHLKGGVFDAEAARKSFKSMPSMKDYQEVVDKSIDECKNKKGASDCDTAFMITKCMMQQKHAN